MSEPVDPVMEDDEFEQLGRRVGAELRAPAPHDGLRLVRRSATRRRVARTIGAATVVVALVITVVAVTREEPESQHLQPVAPVARVVLTFHRGMASTFAFSRDGRRLVTGGGAVPMRTWNTQTGAELTEIPSLVSTGSTDLAFSPDGRRVAVGSYDRSGFPRTTIFVHPEDGSAAAPFPTPWARPDYDQAGTETIRGPDGTLRVEVNSPYGGAALYDRTGHRHALELPRPSGRTWTAAFSPDGKWLAVKFDHRVGLWSLPDLGPPRSIHVPPYGGTAEVMHFSPDSRRLGFTAGRRLVIEPVEEP